LVGLTKTFFLKEKREKQTVSCLLGKKMEMESESESQILAGIFGAEHCTQN
jgi:hypothetical protein